MQVFIETVYAEFEDTVGAETDTEQKEGDSAKGEKVFRRREFIGETFYILLILHNFIITLREKKGKLIAR